ncbi:protein naked cuticle homolog 1 isoform X2 [Lingula anatina]|uniref:Protein naked cuticle homolog n=1 Tax=Lingula anatina TaxID=7574 RepID=A0A1S3JA36_LINAN|nr:protein naked cuticle homolog 1 isoform X2 [Lingula anatina]|eukprot:XP_013407066.1 protein naked cuticle homolog 1 isoform X2 [Lingula anatina]
MDTYKSHPLKVALPPEKDNDMTKVLNLDKEEDGSDVKPVLTDSDNEEKAKDEKDKKSEKPKELDVEEFECGVSVEGTDKEEWSFTLYDFDGKGKITKEDLITLMKSLYDAVGSTVKLPENGNKSLKLRLTISPEKSKENNANVESFQENRLNIEIKETPPTPPLVPRESENLSTPKLTVDLSTPRLSDDISSPKVPENLPLPHLAENLSTSSFTEKQSSSSKLSGSLATPKHMKEYENCDILLSGGKASNLAVKVPEKNIEAMEAPGKESPPPLRPRKPKFSSQEQRHLAELVQKNMERHQLRQEQLKLHHGESNRSHSRDRHSSERRKHRNSSKESRTEVKENQERRNYYLDLAGIDNNPTVSSLHNTSAPAAILTNSGSCRSKSRDMRSKSHSIVRTEQRQQQQISHQSQHQGHFRSRSQDVSYQYFLDGTYVNASEQYSNPAEGATAMGTKASPIYENLPRTPKSRRVPKYSSSPKVRSGSNRPLPVHEVANHNQHYQRRHKHRDRDHRLAMRHVSQWLEKECSVEEHNGQLVIQKHEHHHIHEHHHHHHYHHYTGAGGAAGGATS